MSVLTVTSGELTSLGSFHGVLNVLTVVSGELNGLDFMHGVVSVLTVASGELNGFDSIHGVVSGVWELVSSSPALPSGSARGAMGREHRTRPRSRRDPLNLQRKIKRVK